MDSEILSQFISRSHAQTEAHQIELAETNRQHSAQLLLFLKHLLLQTNTTNSKDESKKNDNGTLQARIYSLKNELNRKEVEIKELIAKQEAAKKPVSIFNSSSASIDQLALQINTLKSENEKLKHQFVTQKAMFESKIDTLKKNSTKSLILRKKNLMTLKNTIDKQSKSTFSQSSQQNKDNDIIISDFSTTPYLKKFNRSPTLTHNNSPSPTRRSPSAINNTSSISRPPRGFMSPTQSARNRTINNNSNKNNPVLATSTPQNEKSRNTRNAAVNNIKQNCNNNSLSSPSRIPTKLNSSKPLLNPKHQHPRGQQLEQLVKEPSRTPRSRSAFDNSLASPFAAANANTKTPTKLSQVLKQKRLSGRLSGRHSLTGGGLPKDSIFSDAMKEDNNEDGGFNENSFRKVSFSSNQRPSGLFTGTSALGAGTFTTTSSFNFNENTTSTSVPVASGRKKRKLGGGGKLITDEYIEDNDEYNDIENKNKIKKVTAGFGLQSQTIGTTLSSSVMTTASNSADAGKYGKSGSAKPPGVKTPIAKLKLMDKLGGISPLKKNNKSVFKI